jgi:hypothetical protein
MPESEYKPVAHDHDAFLKKALERKGFVEAYEGLEGEYRLVRDCWLAPRGRRHVLAVGEHARALRESDRLRGGD